jgi:nitrite reductase/ring-hydroxylating ferredoxin subunit
MAGLTTDPRRICGASSLEEGGKGARFHVVINGERVPAFAIRYAGQVRAYLNRCAHIGVELDWNPGEFLDASGRHIVCATHGANYDPATGQCLSGRCAGRALTALAVEEAGHNILQTGELGAEHA